MIAGVAAWMRRQGAMLISPRAAVAAMAPDEGTRDGTWALLVWLAGTGVHELVEVAARANALRNFDALLLGLADVAIALLAPFVATFVVELVLGRARAHRAGTCLAPMLAAGAALHLAVVWLPWRPPWTWLPAALAGACAVALAVGVRGSIAPLQERRA